MTDIRPRLGVGDVDFCMKTNDLLLRGYREDPGGYDDVTEWRAYVRDDSVTCYVKDGVVVCLVCAKEANLRGVDLIGLNELELENLLGHPDEVGEPLDVDECRQQVPREYYSLGIQVWTEHGRVVSVFCNSVY